MSLKLAWLFFKAQKEVSWRSECSGCGEWFYQMAWQRIDWQPNYLLAKLRYLDFILYWRKHWKIFNKKPDFGWLTRLVGLRNPETETQWFWKLGWAKWWKNKQNCPLHLLPGQMQSCSSSSLFRSTQMVSPPSRQCWWPCRVKENMVNHVLIPKVSAQKWHLLLPLNFLMKASHLARLESVQQKSNNTPPS